MFTTTLSLARLHCRREAAFGGIELGRTPRRRLPRRIIEFVLAASMAGVPLSEASDRHTIAAVVGRGPLDGMIFVGKIGPADNIDLEDELHFAAGQFWSKNCVACGYEPGAYWTRTVGDSIHFRGTLQSSNRGKFEYSGRVLDGHVEATIHWTQHRWYWSVERDLAFAGKMAPTTASRPEPNQLATGVGREDSSQCRRL